VEIARWRRYILNAFHPFLGGCVASSANDDGGSNQEGDVDRVGRTGSYDDAKRDWCDTSGTAQRHTTGALHSQRLPDPTGGRPQRRTAGGESLGTYLHAPVLRVRWTGKHDQLLEYKGRFASRADWRSLMPPVRHTQSL
jgi:hypothetical protein